jgi:hypothetical protein
MSLFCIYKYTNLYTFIVVYPKHMEKCFGIRIFHSNRQIKIVTGTELLKHKEKSTIHLKAKHIQ